MNQILCTLMVMLALCNVIRCKDLRTADNTLCSEIHCLDSKDILRSKRDAAGIIGSVGNLVTGILDSNWRGIEKVQRQKRKKNIFIGPGRNNKNKVYINRRYNYD